MRDASQLPRGDAVVASDQPRRRDRRQGAGARPVDHVERHLPSMARAGDERGGASRLVAAKAVAAGYPLRGALQLRSAPGGGRVPSSRRRPGEAWVDAAVLDALGSPSATRCCSATSAAHDAPDCHRTRPRHRFATFAPRVMFNEADLAASGLIQPASRVSYRLMVAAPPGRQAAVREFVDWTEGQTKARGWRGLRVESLESGRPEMRQTLDRAEKFLNLVALLAALLAAVAVGIAAATLPTSTWTTARCCACSACRSGRSPAVRWRTRGGRRARQRRRASLLGFVVHYVFVWLLAGPGGRRSCPPDPAPALFGLAVGLTLLLGFGLPPVLQLARVPPLRVIRRDLGNDEPASLLVLAAARSASSRCCWRWQATPSSG